MSNYSTALFVVPSWAEGVGRLVDWGATLEEYNTSESTMQADVDAIERDWRAVGEDMMAAVREYAHRR